MRKLWHCRSVAGELDHHSLWGVNLETQSVAKTACHRAAVDDASLSARCVWLGISIRDLDLLTVGLVNDMWRSESDNDSENAPRTGGDAEGLRFIVTIISPLQLWLWRGFHYRPCFCSAAVRYFVNFNHLTDSQQQ